MKFLTQPIIPSFSWSQKFYEYNIRLEQIVKYSSHIYNILNFIYEADRQNQKYRYEVIILLNWYRAQKDLRIKIRNEIDSEISGIDNIVGPLGALEEE